MNEYDLAAANGRIEALHHALTAVISALPPVVAAHAAVTLAAALDVATEEDATDDVPPEQSNSRDQVGRAYLDLLHSVAAHG